MPEANTISTVVWVVTYRLPKGSQKQETFYTDEAAEKFLETIHELGGVALKQEDTETSTTFNGTGELTWDVQ